MRFYHFCQFCFLQQYWRVAKIQLNARSSEFAKNWDIEMTSNNIAKFISFED
jgi:hypothetical protein